MRYSGTFGSISSCIFFSSSSVKVYDSQKYRNMEMIRARISFTFDSREMLESLHRGFSFIRAAIWELYDDNSRKRSDTTGGMGISLR